VYDPFVWSLKAAAVKYVGDLWLIARLVTWELDFFEWEKLRIAGLLSE
jgi:hypothetical protein